MLFNSYGYILAYLPVVAGAYYLLLRLNLRWAVAWLAVASFYFYADWALRYLPLFLGSALFNFGIGRWLENGKTHRGLLLGFGVGVNLALLVTFKYTNFLVEQVLPFAGLHLPTPGITPVVGW